jgi:uncharacterized lipoprotein YddW (UPF0748 family)
MIRRLLSATLFLACTALLLPQSATAQTGPQPRHEFRAAWVSTVSNIDWPSNRNLSTADQKKEMLAILDQAVELNLNAIIFQVRPMCDALYQSPYEPWSEFLTGTMGKAPSPFYDPLQFVIEESHKRGLELHAWFNPYRALTPSAKSAIPDNHVSKRNPAIVRTIGKYLWLDPTEEQTKNYTLNVILDVIRRYDVDGVHLDDYFYPYSSYNDGKDFPDDANWNAYKKSGGKLSRNDWRRDHVNDFVKRLYTLVKEEDARVKVGISPFGIWRPNNPEGIQGMDQYDSLYADPKLWLNEGWLDYLSPQLYWPIDQKPQAYKRLLGWWVSENKKKRHVWPGNYTSRINNTDKSWPVSEIVNQIEATRAQPGAGGNIHFSMVAFTQNRKNINTTLKNGVYSQPALIPPSPWLGNKPPSAPRAAVRREGPGDVVVTWASPEGEDVRRWAVYSNHGGQWKTRIVPAYKTVEGTLRIPGSEKATDIAISAIDRLGNESERTLLRVR